MRQGFFSPRCLPQKTFKLHINDVFVTAEDKKKRDKMKIHYLIVSGGKDMRGINKCLNTDKIRGKGKCLLFYLG